MTMPKFMVFAGAIAALSSLSFAWTINGFVVTNEGLPIGGVKITSPNYPSVDAVTSATGSFSITDGTDVIHNKRTTRASIQFFNNIISISGMNANTITVSVMDALGKVAYSKTMHNMRRSASFDLNKSSIKGAKYLRINGRLAGACTESQAAHDVRTARIWQVFGHEQAFRRAGVHGEETERRAA